MSANVWARALLQHDYGVRMEKIHWLNQESEPDVPYDLPFGMTLETLGEDVDLPDLLAEGKIDALIHPDVVPSKLLARKNVRRHFRVRPKRKGSFIAVRGSSR
jgi:4,5-dihydroxyphthalate decarboxylase